VDISCGAHLIGVNPVTHQSGRSLHIALLKAPPLLDSARAAGAQSFAAADGPTRRVHRAQEVWLGGRDEGSRGTSAPDGSLPGSVPVATYPAPVPKTEADAWFERYLLDHGYNPGEHEPDLGVRSTPDYMPTNAAGEQIVCEVKAFGPNSLTTLLRLGRAFSTSGKELWAPIPQVVRSAARTLKPVQSLGLPLVVVITNTHPMVFVDLTVENVASALLGRGGKLTRDHRYLSAIALLRREDYAYVQQREVTARVRETTPGWDELSRSEQIDRYVEAVEARTFSEGASYWLDVIETRSPTATPLPDHWFAGQRDTRWLLTVEGDAESLVCIRSGAH
jgi:hypothetical protein